jgi:hypothetical protein
MKRYCLGLAFSLSLFVIGCGGGGSSSSTSGAGSGSGSGSGSTMATVSGQVQFQTVGPASSCSSGGACSLDFSSPQTKPGRGLVIDLLNASNNAIIASSITSETGTYSFANLAAGLSVKVRVYSQIYKSGTWNASVIDNTNSGALYALDSTTSTTVAGSTHTLNVLAGLGYSSTGVATDANRKSGPFVIADTLYTAYNKLLAADATLNLQALNVNWSVNNIASSGSITLGQIGTSYWNGTALYILGKADNDSDEFDVAVVAHEFGHYLQSVASYSDSPGGSHSSGQNKDFSLSYGEGYGTAIGALLTNNSIYYDTYGNGNASGFSTVLANITETGAYRENAVIKAIYLLGRDGTGGLNTLWSALKNMRTQAYSATIFGLAQSYRNVGGTLTPAMTSIVGGTSDGWGTGYSDSSANLSAALSATDVYLTGTLGSYTSMCHEVSNYSSGDGAPGNKLGTARRIVYRNVPAGSHTISFIGSLPSSYAGYKLRDSTGDLTLGAGNTFTKVSAGDVSFLVRSSGNNAQSCISWRIS